MDLSFALGVILAFFAVATLRYLSNTHQKALNQPREKQQQEQKQTVQQPSTKVAPKKLQEWKSDSPVEVCSNESCSCIEQKEEEPVTFNKPIRILFGTQTGTSKEWAHKLASDAAKQGYQTQVGDVSAYDLDDLSNESVVLFVVSTYTDGQPPESCVAFYQWFKELAVDFRVGKTFCQSVRYGVFGIGDSIYGKNFAAFAKEIDKLMHSLSGQRISPIGFGDTGTSVEISHGYDLWANELWKALKSSPTQTKKEREVKASEELDEDSNDEEEGEPLVDVEDMGKMIKKPRSKNGNQEEEDDDDDDDDEPALNPDGTPKEMLTSTLRKSLTKQGYKLLGSHSGVKLCRWTKAMLRGRGGCYKHTFYGIQSYQCMEMTPSLACANKCVFCWRHHKNPVGKEWKWQVDAPEELVEAAIKNHRTMIKQLKGVPGVSQERYEEAFTVRHCALSLVGEPIIYPHINRFVDLLHEKEISSFMVTNAQFPDKIDSLKPVTQLYISVDAATKESLKKVDRPIFTDFWERFLGSIDSLKQKGQRTVFRLTLIKEWNMEELKNYAELIQRGEPTFIEIKGVTFCGSSKASSLTMKNVPFHEEVVRFSSMICEANDFMKENYELACEHEHSCCILIANKKFKVNGVWNTWIDYPKFHQLVKEGKEFTAADYMAPTPSWAVIGSDERGFDPEETRFRRTKPYQKQGC